MWYLDVSPPGTLSQSIKRKSILKIFFRASIGPMRAAPDDTDIEVTVFGPGYGECILIHIGSGRWFVVDSCKRSSNSPPIALRYLEMIGANYKECVELVVLTHWHDDHIRGSAELIAKCENANICISQAFNREEFIKFLAAFSGSVQSFSHICSSDGGSLVVVSRLMQRGHVHVFAGRPLCASDVS